MKGYILIILCCLLGCKNNDISNKELNEILCRGWIEYNKTGNKKDLLKPYSYLEKNKDYRENGLQKEFLISATAILIHLEKYDELENTLKNGKNVEPYTKNKIINDLNFYRYKNKDKEKAKYFLNKNLVLITQKIKSNPKDTLLYSEYFGIKTLLIGKENTIKEVDSLFSKNSQYREQFKEMIEDFSGDPKSGADWQK